MIIFSKLEFFPREFYCSIFFRMKPTKRSVWKKIQWPLFQLVWAALAWRKQKPPWHKSHSHDYFCGPHPSSDPEKNPGLVFIYSFPATKNFGPVSSWCPKMSNKHPESNKRHRGIGSRATPAAGGGSLKLPHRSPFKNVLNVRRKLHAGAEPAFFSPARSFRLRRKILLSWERRGKNFPSQNLVFRESCCSGTAIEVHCQIRNAKYAALATHS